MHLPDGFVSGPVNLAGAAIAVAAVGVAVAKLNKNAREEDAPLLGLIAALFAIPALGGAALLMLW